MSDGLLARDRYQNKASSIPTINVQLPQPTASTSLYALPKGWTESREWRDRVGELLRQRTCALSVVGSEYATGKATGGCLTFTCLTYRRVPMLVTCTHVLEQIEKEAKACSSTHEIQYAWHDYAGVLGGTDIPTTSELVTRPTFRAEQRYSDLSLCLLPTNTQRLLSVKNNDRFSLSDFMPSRRIRGAKVELSVVVGYPKDWVRVTKVAPDEVELVQKVAVIPIKESDRSIHDQQQAGAAGHCEARLQVDESQLADMDGMSGGPVVSIVRLPDGTTRPFLLGIQAAWFRDSRRIWFAPTSTLRMAIDEMWKTYRQVAAVQPLRFR